MDDVIEIYAKELRVLIDKSNDAFEKQLNYISASALGLSMLFVEKVVKDLNTTKCNSLLILSWIFLGATLISNLISHVYTSKMHGKTLKEINDNVYNYKKAVTRNNRIGNWNLVSIAFLLIGLAIQIIFITINIKL